VTTYTGNGGTQQITYGYQPDLIFGKPPEATTGGGWNWIDSVRGGDKYLISNSANGEGSFTGGNGVTFNSTGTSVVDVADGSWNLNGNYGGTYVGNGGYVYYGFKAGGKVGSNAFNVDDVGYASAAAAGLTGGSLAVTGASVGTKQGFSIIKFASGSSGNKTLSHGLLETPTFILVKTTDATSDWSVYHKDLGGTVDNYLALNTNAANATASNIWGAAVPTSSVFGINPGTTCATNKDVIAYLWHDVPGLQKFGSYIGNGSADGPFIELGFRPSFIIIKDISDTWSWYMIDNQRSPYNVTSKTLKANEAYAEDTSTTYNCFDFLSNGFKVRAAPSNSEPTNDSGDVYVYAAWAEAPMNNLYGGQSNAR